MDSHLRVYTKSKPININYKNKKKKLIFEEYNLTQSIFNPNKSSPNFFVNKLEMRMQRYYNNFSSSPEKKLIK